MLAVSGAVFLNWRPEVRLWLGGAGFGIGAAFEWFRLGARRYAGLAAVGAMVVIGWHLFPEGRQRVNWLAPVRKTAPAVDHVTLEPSTAPVLSPPEPAPPPRTSRPPARSPVRSPAREPSSTPSQAQAASRSVRRFTIEVHNGEGEALELAYAAGSTLRPLGRISGGATQRFSVEGVVGSTIQVIATVAGTAGGDTLTISVRLSDTGEVKRVTLRRT
jgi:hypothetical protein